MHSYSAQPYTHCRKIAVDRPLDWHRAPLDWHLGTSPRLASSPPGPLGPGTPGREGESPWAPFHGAHRAPLDWHLGTPQRGVPVGPISWGPSSPRKGGGIHLPGHFFWFFADRAHMMDAGPGRACYGLFGRGRPLPKIAPRRPGRRKQPGAVAALNAVARRRADAAPPGRRPPSATRAAPPGRRPPSTTRAAPRHTGGMRRRGARGTRRRPTRRRTGSSMSPGARRGSRTPGSARTARIMTGMLREVVLHGTGIAAAKMPFPVAGKTGTTNDFTDAWFVGFSPAVTCGVWVGFDEKKSLGAKETGAHAALPIWMNFMNSAMAGKDPGQFQPAPEMPSTIAQKVDTPDSTPGIDETH